MKVVLSILVLIFGVNPSFSQVSLGNSSWNNLAQLTRKATFIFVLADRSCIAGNISSFTDASVAGKDRVGQAFTILRQDLLRVTYGAWAPGILFSNRSSWADLTALDKVNGQSLHAKVLVHLKSGEVRQGKLVDVSEDELAVDSGHKVRHIHKSEISTVDFFRPKPLSDSAAYADDELSWMKVFDPQLWPKLLGLRGALSVRVFDSSIPEDNSPIVCRNDPFGLSAHGPDVTRPLQNF